MFGDGMEWIIVRPSFYPIIILLSSSFGVWEDTLCLGFGKVCTKASFVWSQCHDQTEDFSWVGCGGTTVFRLTRELDVGTIWSNPNSSNGLK